MKIKKINKYFASILFLLIMAMPVTPLAAFDLQFDMMGIGGSGFASGSPAVSASVVVGLVLSFVGLIFLILIIYAGFVMAFAGGNEDKVTKSRKIITMAVGGLVVTLCAYGIAYIVFNAMNVPAGTGPNVSGGDDNIECVKAGGKCREDKLGPDNNGCEVGEKSLGWKGCGFGNTCCMPD